MKLSAFIILLLACSSCSEPNKVHWSYDGEESPEHWAELSTHFGTCEKGRNQSPLDIHPDIATAKKHELKVFYHPTPTKIVNNSHTIEFDMEEPNYLFIEDHKYELVQFHFHADSEHTVDGTHYPAEMHLVHKDKRGELAVLGLLMDVSNEDQDHHFFDKVPHVNEELHTEIHLENLLPSDQTHYYYDGSLTTPPCTEGVRWVVFKEPISISKNQLKKFNAYYSHNFRETQKDFHRNIYVSL